MTAKKPKRKKTVSRPKRKAPVQLTGGSGFRFENSVAARFLLDMLLGGNSLGADLGRIVRLDWQARDVGWHADDLAVTSQTASGEERAAGLSIKSYPQLSGGGFNSEFSLIAWRQWLNQDTNRKFRRSIDSVVLATGALADGVARAWSDLRTQSLQSSPERVLMRLTSETYEGAQTSKVQRSIFASLRRPSQ